MNTGDLKMPVNAKTELYGVFGFPARHSLSPLIHNTLFIKYDINAVYLAFPVPPESLALAFEAIRALGIRGANITVPHKEAATDFIDEIPEDVDRCIGAINTVVNKDGQLLGYNTDGPGFLIALKEELNFNPEGKSVLVLGAGGAARGVVFALARAHTDKIFIHNRTPERGEGLREYVQTYFPETEIISDISAAALADEKIQLVVNATSCGMKSEDPLPFDLKTLKTGASVYDLIYAPSATPLLRTAQALKLPHTNGLGMLAAQAALSFRLWTGRADGVREAMLETLRACSL